MSTLPRILCAIHLEKASERAFDRVAKERLDDLRRVAGDLTFVDAVVAENGALVHFPGGGQTTILARLSRVVSLVGSRS